MSREHAIQFEGTIVELLPHSVFRVELANGHRLVAFPGQSIRTWAAGLVCGDRVTVEVSPGNFSAGRIRRITEAERAMKL